jgi:hypothetical protein
MGSWRLPPLVGVLERLGPPARLASSGECWLAAACLAEGANARAGRCLLEATGRHGEQHDGSFRPVGALSRQVSHVRGQQLMHRERARKRYECMTWHPGLYHQLTRCRAAKAALRYFKDAEHG